MSKTAQYFTFSPLILLFSLYQSHAQQTSWSLEDCIKQDINYSKDIFSQKSIHGYKGAEKRYAMLSGKDNNRKINCLPF